ncbi:hypothetical protein [Streptomyces sp. NPDC048248]|uniref:hypothetical protein n=1 Tax=Streptomyces sp. NPDC048248 TaxID=3365523 RepID=UPI0037224016
MPRTPAEAHPAGLEADAMSKIIAAFTEDDEGKAAHDAMGGCLRASPLWKRCCSRSPRWGCS